MLKGQLAQSLCTLECEIVDLGAYGLNPADDYPDFIVPLAKAIAKGQVERGVALCGSGVGASITANKVSPSCGPGSSVTSSPPVRASKTTI